VVRGSEPRDQEKAIVATFLPALSCAESVWSHRAGAPITRTKLGSADRQIRAHPINNEKGNNRSTTHPFGPAEDSRADHKITGMFRRNFAAHPSAFFVFA
jgi:hypothetical protein